MKREEQPVLLLIDDAPAIHRLLTYKLKNEDLEFLTAFSGEEGLELARSNQPSLVLVDIRMPGISGFDVLKALKDDPATVAIPVIVISGSTDSESKVRAFEMGAMDFISKPFDLHELRARIGSAIRLSRLMRMLSQRAQIDGLTGLWNRAYFGERLDSELNASRRSGQPVSLVLCDLDRFKNLNDTFGHLAGDAVLQGFADLLVRELRSCDIACRYGGEEFGIILPGTGSGEAVHVSERVRNRLEARVWPAASDVTVTASFGVVSGVVREDSEVDIYAWVEAADRALYRAKETGRNRVVLHDAEVDEAGPTYGLAG